MRAEGKSRSTSPNLFDHPVFCIIDSGGCFLVKLHLFRSLSLQGVRMKAFDRVLVGTHDFGLVGVLMNSQNFMGSPIKPDAGKRKRGRGGRLWRPSLELCLSEIRTGLQNSIEVLTIRLPGLEIRLTAVVLVENPDQKKDCDQESDLDLLKVFRDHFERGHGPSIKGPLRARQGLVFMESSLRFLTSEWLHALLFHHPVASGVDGLLRLMGVVHLYGASGIHLYAVLNWIEWGFKNLGRKKEIPVRWIRFLILVAFLGVSILIWRGQGFSFALFRPLCTILLRLLLRELGVRIWIFGPLVVTLGLESLFCFKTGLSPGAYHYYLAVGGSLVALLGRNSVSSGFKLHLEMAIYSWIPIAILDLLKDRLVSPLTPALSLITIPPLTLFLFPFTLLVHAITGGIPEPVFLLWMVFLKCLLFLLSLGPTIFSVSKQVFLTATGAFLLATCLPRRDLTRQVLIFVGSIPVVWLFARTPVNQVVQFDVGQGDSALIQEGSRAELIDAGPVPHRGVDPWIRRLSRVGVTKLDAVLLTHLDQDHSGGLPVLLSLIPTSCLLISGVHQETKKGKSIVSWVRRCSPETEVQKSGCIRLSRVEWFRSTRKGAGGNALMAGIARRISRTEGYFALGDGDASQELQLEERFRSRIEESSHTIWKVGHHGSKSSSDSGFLARLNPQEFWISVGKKNPYHHPSLPVLVRMSGLAGILHRTDREGDLIYRAGGSTW